MTVLSPISFDSQWKDILGLDCIGLSSLHSNLVSLELGSLIFQGRKSRDLPDQIKLVPVPSEALPGFIAIIENQVQLLEADKCGSSMGSFLGEIATQLFFHIQVAVPWPCKCMRVITYRIPHHPHLDLICSIKDGKATDLD